MKPNVDLTENQDFRTDSPSALRTLATNLSVEDSKQTVRVGLYDYIIQEAMDEIVLTGDKQERSYKRMQLDFCVPNQHCDRCGTTVAWRFVGNSSLCDSCQKDIETKKPWWRKM